MALPGHEIELSLRWGPFVLALLAEWAAMALAVFAGLALNDKYQDLKFRRNQRRVEGFRGH